MDRPILSASQSGWRHNQESRIAHDGEDGCRTLGAAITPVATTTEDDGLDGGNAKACQALACPFSVCSKRALHSPQAPLMVKPISARTPNRRIMAGILPLEASMLAQRLLQPQARDRLKPRSSQSQRQNQLRRKKAGEREPQSPLRTQPR